MLRRRSATALSCVLATVGMSGRAADSRAANRSPPLPVATSTAELPRAALLPISVAGTIADADRVALTMQLLVGLERGDFVVIPPEVVRTHVRDAAECARARCLVRVADKTGATHVVRAVITGRDRHYKLQLDLVDGRTGSVIASSRDGCEICGVSDVGDLMASAAAGLRNKLDALATGPAALVLSSRPAGATIIIDGEIVGTSPLELSVSPGKHVIRVQREGFISAERELVFVNGVAEKMSFELERLPSRLPGRTWGWVSLAAGAVALGTGVAFTAVHADAYQPDCDPADGNQDSNQECRFLWNTKWGGVAAAAAGTAWITFGVAVLLNRPGERVRVADEERTTRLGIGPGSLVIHGRF